MNDDDPFEKKLRELAGGLRRPDPTLQWKAEILARARRESRPSRKKERFLPPRWLAVSWAAAWAAILVLGFTAPREPEFPSSRSASGGSSAPQSAGDLFSPGSPTLLAFHQHLNLNLDLP